MRLRLSTGRAATAHIGGWRCGALLLLSLPAVSSLAAVPDGQAREALTPREWAAKIHAGWVGKVAAGSGALPTEMWPKERIREKYGALQAPPQTPNSRGPLDDTTLAFLGWQAAREHGPDFTSADIAREWVDHLTETDLKGGGFGKEFLGVLARLRTGAQPPVDTGPPRGEWIAAQMRAEIWGLLAPGDPKRAADYAARDAGIFNTGGAVHAAQFVAALASQLMVDTDIPTAVQAARRQIPAESVLARLVGDVVRWHGEAPHDWEKAWRVFTETYRDRSLAKRFEEWSPEWLVETGGWPEAEVLADYRGRSRVLRSHPFSDTEPARLTTEVAVPARGGSLRLCVACNELPANVDWLLRVRIDETVKEWSIHWVNGEPRWREIHVDLRPWAGQRITVVLENAVLGKQAWEAGFWTAPELRDAEGGVLRGRRPDGRAHRYPLDFRPMVLPETFSVLVGLLYGGGDFRQSVSLATMCGFDTDCNAGTVGCLLGLRNGLDAIPDDWKAPLRDTYELQVTGLPRQWRIADLAREMADTGAALTRVAPASAVGTSTLPAESRSGDGTQELRSVTAARGEARGKREGAAATPWDIHEESRLPVGLDVHAGTPVAWFAEAPARQDKAEGFGAGSKGGEGGRILTVTTLSDSGPGSLREALSAQGPRVILFAVEGTIELRSRLRCSSGQVTIDGGSAPGKGVTLLNHGIQFRGDCDDIIVRNLRIRVLTGGAEGDCLLFWGNEGGTVERVLVDHCSLMWATDEIVNTWGQVRDLTCQWTIIARAQLPHSKGWLSGVGSDRISIHHCLFAHNADRVPKLEGGVFDVVNNVFYNWGRNNAAKIESGARVNLVNNCFLAGTDSTPASGCVFPDGREQGTKVFVSGNYGPYTRTGTEDQWSNVTWYERAGNRWAEHRPAPAAFRADKSYPAPAIVTQSPKEAYDLILARAGANVRDEDDLRVIEDVKARSGHVGR